MNETWFLITKPSIVKASLYHKKNPGKKFSLEILI